MSPLDKPRERAEILGVIHGMYANYLVGNRGAIDAVLAADFTMFDSDHAELIVGFDQLNAVRNSRPAGSEVPDESLSVFGEHLCFADRLAVATYWLRVDFVGPGSAGREPELVRNTAVLVHGGSGWRILHIHEDVHGQTTQTA